MRLRILVTAALCLFSSARAWAQPQPWYPAPSPAPAVEVDTWHPRRWAWGSAAAAIVAANVVLAGSTNGEEGRAPSARAGAVAGALFGYALLASPLAGHVITDQTGYGLTTTAGRVGLVAGGLALDYMLLFRDKDATDPIPLFSLLGVSAAVVWTVMDIGRLPSDYVKPEARSWSSVYVAPTVVPAAGTASVGVAVSGLF